MLKEQLRGNLRHTRFGKLGAQMSPPPGSITGQVYIRFLVLTARSNFALRS